jgi:cytochrome c553/mono/diheme cytochrome c family protein
VGPFTRLAASSVIALLGALPLAALGTAAPEVAGSSLDAADFFEREVRPVLVDHCQACHGAKEAKGGLRLLERVDALKGGERGPALVPGKPEASLLIRALEHTGPVRMPPAGKLPGAQIARLRQWVAMGAPWPEAGVSGATPGEYRPTDAQRQWWAYQPLRPASPPAVRGATGETEIDRFLRAQLRRNKLPRAKPADRRTLLRRATFDLTGLPPTPDEAVAFLEDRSPDAYARVIDRLLASPAYGQRTARRWLDVVRYADYHDGNAKARDLNCEPVEAWRYRDWVVDAFNRDLPFDQFIVHQIAGDLLPSPEGAEVYTDGLIATTFLSNGSWDRGDADKEKMVSDMVDDQIDTIGKAFLGVTLGCARCHDHKFDPVSQKDYYALAGMFYSTRILQDLGAKGANYVLLRTPLAPADHVRRYEEQRQALAAVRAKLTEVEKQDPPDEPARQALVERRTRLEAEMLPPPPLAEAAREGGTPGGLFPEGGDVPLHIRGSYTQLGEVVPRGLPAFLAANAQVSITRGSGRNELAAWIASPDNPLTARVIVNRVWQWHFGAGLVRTPNNFGLLSEPPSHPELLDWLAADFIANGWSLKALHRQIMLTAAYQQTSAVPRKQVERDPENRWVSRFTPRRLEAEEIRDAMLWVAGSLDPAPGGPATDDSTTSRRSLYLQTARWDRSSFAFLFDAANPDASVEQRTVSTVAPQALFLLNHEFTLKQARQFAERLTREVPPNDRERVHRAYELLFARPPTSEELAIGLRMLGRPTERDETAAWSGLAHVLLSTNEFVYVD